MEKLLWSIGASLVVSLISLVGIFGLLLKEKLLDRLVFILIGFSAGALIAAAFLHLLPEALEQSNYNTAFLYIILGFIFFFILERYLHWRHCHDGVCQTHPFTYLSLIGDGVHNFTDGLVIGASFTVSVNFGLITTAVIIFHEIPQEIGDFGILIYGGFSRAKALSYNFLSALTCVLGAIIGSYLSERVENFFVFLLPVIAGGFIYIAACDLVPEMHKQPGLKRATFSIAAFLCGVLFIWLMRQLHLH